MRRVSLVAISIAFALAALPSASWGSDHGMGINEVMLSNAGDAVAQFVELRDTLGNEPFPSVGYQLRSYDASGAPHDVLPLSQTELDMAGTNPYLISTGQADAALSVTGDEPLPANFLPAGSGQVCFEGEMGARRIYCVAYGCPASPLSGARAVKAPADSQSVQRQGSGSSYALAAPTAKEANVNGASASCTGGGGPGPGPGPDPNDTTDPDQTLGFKKKQDVDKLAVTVTLDEAGTVVVTGSVNVPGASAKVKVRKVTKSVKANVKTRIRIKLKKKPKKRVKAALDGGKKPKASLTIRATDLNGNSSTKKPKIKLKD